MSIGNLKTEGNKGNNFPYQLKTLQLLGAINDGILALPGVDHESRTSTYQAINNGVGYSIGDIIIRYDIIDLATGLLEATIWFNDTLQTQLVPPPLPGDLTPISAPSGVTVLNGSAGSAVNIQDGGNSITVDANNLDIRDLAFASDKVDVSGSSISVSNFPATQPVSATSLPLPTGAATAALQTQPGVDIGDVTINNISGAGAVNIQDGGNVISVDDAGASLTVDSNGVTRTTNLLRVTLASGTVAAGTYGASFASVGTANATVKGITLKPGETINFDPGGINNVLDAIAYNASTANAELLIIYLT
jgi:hypothetical protein